MRNLHFKKALRQTLLLSIFLAPMVNAKPVLDSRAEKVGSSTKRLTPVTEMIQPYVAEGEMAGIVTVVARKIASRSLRQSQ